MDVFKARLTAWVGFGHAFHKIDVGLGCHWVGLSGEWFCLLLIVDFVRESIGLVVNGWLFEIGRWLLGVKSRGFLVPARPPLLRRAGGRGLLSFFFIQCIGEG